MFCGIGGFRLGLERSGWRCVWANDIDRYACQIYRKNFGGGELVEGDIRSIDAGSVPDHTLLTAGFPCQSFSLAGKRKGFEDARGTLFYDIARVAGAKRPPLLLLENVRGLLSNDGGRTFARILQTLDELGYDVEWQVLNSKHFGVPQNRERVFIVGHLRGAGSGQVFPIAEGPEVAGGEPGEPGEQAVNCIDGNYWKGADKHGQRTVVAESGLFHSRGFETRKDGVSHALKGAGGGSSKNFVLVIDGHHKQFTEEMGALTGRENRQGTNWAITVLGNIYPSGGEAGKIHDAKGIFSTVKQGKRGGKAGVPPVLHNGKIRRLTPVECERLQGFPDGWTEGVSDTQRYRLLGNAVTVNVVEYLGARLLGCLQ
jgi:DNA (cytosine-5)-methyltransferase 1